MSAWCQDIQNVLVDAAQIEERVCALGEQITADYGDSGGHGDSVGHGDSGDAPDPVVLIGILKGSLFFLADLARAISTPVEIELMAISSYGASDQSSGVVRILKDLDASITGRRVLIVEDIIDTGLTLSYLLRSLRARQPRSLTVCTLLDKPARRSVDIPIGYLGFTVPDEFVVGYGLDFNQRYRNLPFIGVLKPECYEVHD